MPTYLVVDLPCLRVLEISSGVAALTAALLHITFPQNTILNITCRGEPSTQIDFSNFSSVLVKNFLSSLVIRTLSFKYLDDRREGLEFYFWTTIIIQTSFFPSSLIPVQPQLRLVLTWLSPKLHDYVEGSTSAFDSMNFHFLTQLHISTENYIDSQTWAKFFGRLPLLERVCAKTGSTHSFLKALVCEAKAAEKSRTGYRNVSLPGLRYIYLEGTIFFKTTPVDMLLDYFKERCERNAEIQVLYLVECLYISSDDLERLKEIVLDVIWDGIGILGRRRLGLR